MWRDLVHFCISFHQLENHASRNGFRPSDDIMSNEIPVVMVLGVLSHSLNIVLAYNSRFYVSMVMDFC